MESLKDVVKGIEREAIAKALEECNGVRARAARRLGITARMIGYKIRKYRISIKEMRWIDDSSAEQHGK